MASAPEGASARGAPTERARSERYLTILMGARLALSIASLVIALGLERQGGHITLTEWRGFYGAVVLAFAATAVYWLFAGRVERIRPFAIANIALDLCLVSALVTFSGGGESVFTFLYVVVPAYAALLLSGRGAVACGALAGAAYAVVLLSERAGAPAREGLDAVLAVRWAVHTGAILLVAVLASFLVGELERAGQALSERTSDLEHLRTLHQRTVESLMSGLFTTDASGRITSSNPEAERITGLSRADARGRDMEEVLPGVGELLRHRVGSSTRTRMRFTDREGNVLHLGVGAYVLRDGEGGAAGHVVIFQDVSGVVQMEQELTRQERLAAVGALSASIAHEIRNPLAAISGAIQMLRTGAGGDGGGSARLMDIAVREVDRLNQLITDFLEFARPAPLRQEEVAVGDLVSDVVRMHELAPTEGVRVCTHLEPGLSVWADPSKLRQVLWNLLRNGVEAMPAGGILEIRAARAPEDPAQGSDSGDRMEDGAESTWVEISVLDQGSGIDPEIAKRMFDPFFTTKRKGSGLGLSTVHRIVVEHGGSIRVERAAPPFVTAVQLRLPGPEKAT
jgi:two-component system sensor histidine kinase PilS (NtrC family)